MIRNLASGDASAVESATATAAASSGVATSDSSTMRSDEASASKSSLLKTFHVSHSMQPNVFSPRGVIEILLDNQGNLVSSFQSFANVLPREELEGLDALVANGGYYKVRVQEGEVEGALSVLASVSGCDVKRSNFREEFGLTLGNTGSIISLSYKPLVSPLAPPCHELKPFVTETTDNNEKEYKFKTKVSLSIATPGIAIPAVLPNTRPPIGYDWIKRSQKSSSTETGGDSTRREGEGGSGATFDPLQDEKPEHPSFLRRYWYIILPVAIMTFMAPEEPAASNPQSQSGSGSKMMGGGTGAPVAAAAAASTVTAAAPSIGVKQRRGKRG